MSERVLITGGAGFLGLAVARRLAAEASVVLFDKLCHDPALQRERAATLGCELIEADVCDPDALGRAVAGCSRVVHMASLAGVERVSGDPVGTMRCVLVGTANLLAACQRLDGLQRMVLVSTSEVYGHHADQVGEDSTVAPLAVGHARWTYAAAKLAAEHLGLAYHRQAGLPVVVVRPFNVYGPGQLGRSAVKTFIERALVGAPLELHGGGDQVRAWCHVDDFVDGLLAALFNRAARGRIYNLGNPDGALSVRALAERIVRLCGSPSPIVDAPGRRPDVVRRVPSIDRARRELGFCPGVDPRWGLRHTLDGCRRARTARAPEPRWPSRPGAQRRPR